MSQNLELAELGQLISVNTTSVSIGNSTVNTAISAGNIAINGVAGQSVFTWNASAEL